MFNESDSLRGPRNADMISETERIRVLAISNRPVCWDGDAGLVKTSSSSGRGGTGYIHSSKTRSIFRKEDEREKDRNEKNQHDEQVRAAALEEELRNPLKLTFQPSSFTIWSALDNMVPDGVNIEQAARESFDIDIISKGVDILEAFSNVNSRIAAVHSRQREKLAARRTDDRNTAHTASSSGVETCTTTTKNNNISQRVLNRHVVSETNYFLY